MTDHAQPDADGATPAVTASNPPQDERTRDQLLEAARDLEVPGRSRMNAEQLLEAVQAAELERTLAGELPVGTPDEVGRPPLAEVAEQRAAELEAKTRVIGAAADDTDAQEAHAA